MLWIVLHFQWFFFFNDNVVSNIFKMYFLLHGMLQMGKSPCFIRIIVRRSNVVRDGTGGTYNLLGAQRSWLTSDVYVHFMVVVPFTKSAAVKYRFSTSIHKFKKLRRLLHSFCFFIRVIILNVQILTSHLDFDSYR